MGLRAGGAITPAHPPSALHAQNRVDGLYIVLISMHGLIRGQHMELGRDADTGGQVSPPDAEQQTLLYPELIAPSLAFEGNFDWLCVRLGY